MVVREGWAGPACGHSLGRWQELCLARGAGLGRGAPAQPQQLMVQWESLASNGKMTAGGLGWASGGAQQGGDVSVRLPAEHQLFAMSLGVSWGSQG